jgi:hypothetical protein
LVDLKVVPYVTGKELAGLGRFTVCDWLRVDWINRVGLWNVIGEELNGLDRSLGWDESAVQWIWSICEMC